MAPCHEKEKMFCKNCGQEFEDGQAFCPQCGQRVETEAEPAVNEAQPAEYNAPSFEAQKKGGAGKLVPAIIACVVIVAAVIVLIALLGGGPKKTVKKYFKALNNGDSKKLTELSVPKKSIEDFLDDTYDMDTKEYYEAMDAVYDALWDGLKDEGKVKFEYEFKDIEQFGKLDKYKKDMKDRDLKDLDDFRDKYEDFFEDTLDIDTKDIKAAYVVEVKWSLTVDGDKAIKGSDTKTYMYIYKYKGDYYIYNGPTIYSFLNKLDYDDYDDVIDDVYDAIEDNFD